MLNTLNKMGLSSSVMYGMGFASIGASVASWAISRSAEAADIDRADRWGIFVGTWAPTFFALGCAMRLEEQWGPKGTREQMKESRERAREAMPIS
ncbi:hypothetical protein [Actinomadura rugatobispora]|uniref:MFS transporter n=1 Tax=Actinomadura rugatobispora TaxID=1994 RepID=A0ABW0ZUJ5_9ACTN|nr:hypothetical protein GCM10010200_077260 [Actinomadura rugatobispora]